LNFYFYIFLFYIFLFCSGIKEEGRRRRWWWWFRFIWWRWWRRWRSVWRNFNFRTQVLLI